MKSGTVKLASKTYCFNNVTLNAGAKLQVTGAVTINLTGKLTGAGTIVNTTNLPAKLHINSSFSSAGGVSIKGGAKAALTIVAPKTSVAITGGSFFGTVLARNGEPHRRRRVPRRPALTQNESGGGLRGRPRLTLQRQASLAYAAGHRVRTGSSSTSPTPSG